MSPSPSHADEQRHDLRPDTRYIGTPEDPGVHHRLSLLRNLNVEMKPDDEFDHMARRLAEAVGAPRGLAMVNFIGPDHQYFAGLYSAGRPMERQMGRADGWCPHTVLRQVPFPLANVAQWARFQSNRVADEFGIESYLGTPLLSPDGTLGTMCVIDTQTHEWTRNEVEIITASAQQVVELIYRRAELAGAGGR